MNACAAASSLGRVSAYIPSFFLASHAFKSSVAYPDSAHRPETDSMADTDAIESLTTLRHGREGRGHGDTVTGAILFDGTRLPQARAEWFEPGYWGPRAQPVHAGGRGGAWFVDAPFGPAVLRLYLRGGMAARLSRDRYLWQGEARVRSFAEFRLTQKLHGLGLPVAQPIAAH